MKPFLLISICLCSIITGLLFWAYNSEYLIIALRTHPSKNMHESIHTVIRSIKKQATLSFWHHDRWNSEKIELLWSDNNAENIQHLIARWLIVLDEEKIINRRVSLQSALFGPSSQEIYLSFDRNLLTKDNATYTKLMLIESLLKTIRENGIPVTKIWFLVHHQPMHDPHLDFSHAWPISGFL
jgi:hypothetical protein